MAAPLTACLSVARTATVARTASLASPWSIAQTARAPSADFRERLQTARVPPMRPAGMATRAQSRSRARSYLENKSTPLLRSVIEVGLEARACSSSEVPNPNNFFFFFFFLRLFLIIELRRERPCPVERRTDHRKGSQLGRAACPGSCVRSIPCHQGRAAPWWCLFTSDRHPQRTQGQVYQD